MRRLDTLLVEEMHEMPVTYDLRDSLVVQKFMKEGREEGLQQGLERGREEGLTATRRMLTLLLKQRFGRIPTKISRKVAAADLAAIEQWSLRVVKARSLDERFG